MVVSFGQPRWSIQRIGGYLLNEDVRTIVEASSAEEALTALVRRLRVPETLDPTEFLERYDRAGSRFLRLMVYLVIFQRGAVDWVDRTRIGYDKTGSPITAGYEPEWHHIYPQSVLRRAGVKDDDIHALANITVLNAESNEKRLKAKEPWRYIRDFGITTQCLRDHAVPENFPGCEQRDQLLRERWDVQNYNEFLLARAQVLADWANAFLESLRSGKHA